MYILVIINNFKFIPFSRSRKYAKQNEQVTFTQSNKITSDQNLAGPACLQPALM